MLHPSIHHRLCCCSKTDFCETHASTLHSCDGRCSPSANVCLVLLSAKYVLCLWKEKTKFKFNTFAISFVILLLILPAVLQSNLEHRAVLTQSCIMTLVCTRYCTAESLMNVHSYREVLVSYTYHRQAVAYAHPDRAAHLARRATKDTCPHTLEIISSKSTSSLLSPNCARGNKPLCSGAETADTSNAGRSRSRCTWQCDSLSR